MQRAALTPHFAESHTALAAEAAGRLLDEHSRRTNDEVAQLRLELHQLKVERIGRCEEQLFEHRHMLDGLAREKMATEELAQRLARAEQKLGEHRRGQEAALHGLDEERHVRELRQEQFAARLDSIASAMEGTRKQLGREQEGVMQHVHAILDERDTRLMA